ncbi:hypothetical protein [Virgibacillus halodenitrificans]|uniref:hypothetical protein n=1 Tax=Virgibacillus halodenitrificans TaxID=1482 RepID=UPI0013CE4D0E|nr:hypothetical protein [Virgibacillus halodenitrificans]
MKATVEFGCVHEEKMIFTNVPVSECVNCDEQMSYSFRDGLIIEHYVKHHGKSGESINFEEVQSAYEGMSIQNLLTYNQTMIQ